MFFGILAALFIAVPAFATPGPVAAKKAEAQRVLGEIGQLDDSLGRANERLNLANIKLDHVQAQIKENSRELHVAKQNLKSSQQTIAKRLVTLYTKGESSPLEVILGARSLTEVLNRMETEDKVSSLGAQVIEQVITYRSAVKLMRASSSSRRRRSGASSPSARPSSARWSRSSRSARSCSTRSTGRSSS